MDLLQEVELEVQELADNMTVDVILRLLDKWEKDAILAKNKGKWNMQEALSYYVRLKVAMHHILKNMDRDDWLHARVSSGVNASSNMNINNLDRKISKARRDYYVAKREYEGEHVAGCSCRGCKCITGIPR